MCLREGTELEGQKGVFSGFRAICEACHSDEQGNLGFLYVALPCLPLVLHACIPTGWLCQGFLRTCIYVNHLGNHAMTSLASVILHHSLAFFPCPDSLNNCFPD